MACDDCVEVDGNGKIHPIQNSNGGRDLIGAIGLNDEDLPRRCANTAGTHFKSLVSDFQPETSYVVSCGFEFKSQRVME
jgi:hypothetical protein